MLSKGYLFIFGFHGRYFIAKINQLTDMQQKNAIKLIYYQLMVKYIYNVYIC